MEGQDAAQSTWEPGHCVVTRCGFLHFMPQPQPQPHHKDGSSPGAGGGLPGAAGGSAAAPVPGGEDTGTRLVACMLVGDTKHGGAVQARP